jgi:general secretion pathway protein I
MRVFIPSVLDKKAQAGFTLLEVMISLAILAGVVLTVISSLSYHLSVVAGNREMVTAVMLGREKAEEAALFGLPEADAGAFPAPFDRFSWGMVKTDTEVPGLKRVGITISREGADSVSFVSYFGG